MYIIVQRGFLENVHEVIANILNSLVDTIDCSTPLIAIQAFAENEKVSKDLAAFDEHILAVDNVHHMILILREFYEITKKSFGLESTRFLLCIKNGSCR